MSTNQPNGLSKHQNSQVTNRTIHHEKIAKKCHYCTVPWVTWPRVGVFCTEKYVRTRVAETGARLVHCTTDLY